MLKKLLFLAALALFPVTAHAQAPNVIPGCVYNATPPTLANKQTVAIQCDSAGKLKTTGGSIGPGVATTCTASTLLYADAASLLQCSKTIPFNVRLGTSALTLGAADAAAPVAQTLSVQNVVAGTSNTAGADFVIAGSQGTGTGAGGSLVFQTAAAGTTGTSQNALAAKFTINSAGQMIGAGNGTAAAVLYGMRGVVNTGFFSGGASAVDVSIAGSNTHEFATNGRLFSGGTAAGLFLGASDAQSATDVTITRNSAAGKIQIGTTSNNALGELDLATIIASSNITARALISAGAVPTLTLAGGTCAGTAIAGGSTAGTVTLTGVCVATNTLTLSVMPTATTGYACDATDRTLGTVALAQTGTSTTTAVFTFLATTGGTDVLSYKCIAY